MAQAIEHRLERVLLYDADCGFCQRWCDWAQRRGAAKSVRFEPCQAAVELRALAGISEVECGHSAILVETDHGNILRTRRAASAINGVLARLPGARNFMYRAVGRLYFIPGLRQLEDVGYRMVARNRHKFGGGSCKPDPHRN